MKEARPLDLVVVGSVALDTIETADGTRRDVLGGSASYACVAAAPYTRCGMVGVVGRDFPESHIALYRRCGIDTEGLRTEEGRTFRWSGRYSADFRERHTLATALNVFEHFEPALPERYTRAPLLLLGNIAPALQLQVLEQMTAPRFVMADTMNLWIHTARSALLDVIRRVDLLTLNDEEAFLLTETRSMRNAAEALRRLGPRHVLIKKGEHGCLLVSDDGLRLLPAFPLDEVRDPTGAGDSFAGACMAALSRETGGLDGRALADALLLATVVASFAVEDFSVEALAAVDPGAVAARLADFRAMLPRGPA